MTNKQSLATFVADRIRELRKEKGLTQEALSETAQLDVKYVNKLENYRHTIRLETLEQLLDALGITYSSFFNFNIQADTKLIEELLVTISKLPKNKKEKTIKALISLLEE